MYNYIQSPKNLTFILDAQTNKLLNVIINLPQEQDGSRLIKNDYLQRLMRIRSHNPIDASLAILKWLKLIRIEGTISTKGQGINKCFLNYDRIEDTDKYSIEECLKFADTVSKQMKKERNRRHSKAGGVTTGTTPMEKSEIVDTAPSVAGGVTTGTTPKINSVVTKGTTGCCHIGDRHTKEQIYIQEKIKIKDQIYNQKDKDPRSESTTQLSNNIGSISEFSKIDWDFTPEELQAIREMKGKFGEEFKKAKDGLYTKYLEARLQPSTSSNYKMYCQQLSYSMSA